MLDAFTWYRQSALKWKRGSLTVHVDPWGTPEGDDIADGGDEDQDNMIVVDSDGTATTEKVAASS